MDYSKSEILKYIGKRVSKFRKGANLSREQLAEMADMPLFRLCECERGRSDITVDTLVRISKATHVPVTYFLYDYVYR